MARWHEQPGTPRAGQGEHPRYTGLRIGGARPEQGNDLLGVVLYVYLEVIQARTPACLGVREFLRHSSAIDMKVRLSAVGSSA